METISGLRATFRRDMETTIRRARKKIFTDIKNIWINIVLSTTWFNKRPSPRGKIITRGINQRTIDLGWIPYEGKTGVKGSTRRLELRKPILEEKVGHYFKSVDIFEGDANAKKILRRST